MSEKDITTVRRMFACFMDRDVEGTLSALDENVEFTSPATASAAGREGPYRGHDGIRQYFADVASVWDDFWVSPEDFRSVAGSVVIFGRVRARRAEETLDLNVLWTWRLRGGLVVSGTAFPIAEPRPS